MSVTVLPYFHNKLKTGPFTCMFVGLCVPLPIIQPCNRNSITDKHENKYLL